MKFVITKLRVIERWVRYFFDLSLQGENLKCRLAFPKYFVWNVQANAEKGVAGGTIKVNFTMKSAFMISVLLFAITLFCRPVTQYLIPSIFFFFSLYALKVLMVELYRKTVKRDT